MRVPVSDDPYGNLDRLATNVRGEARREYARVAAEICVAERIALQGPPGEGKPSLAPEQLDKLARLVTKAGSFVDARTLVENAPKEVLEQRDRWVIVDVLDTAAEKADEELGRYKAELGFDQE